MFALVEASAHPSSGPINYKPYSAREIKERNKRDTGNATAPHAPHHQQYGEYAYTPETQFDDAPEIIYGTVVRTREFFDCNGQGQDCEDLEQYGKVVDCNIARFR